MLSTKKNCAGGMRPILELTYWAITNCQVITYIGSRSLLRRRNTAKSNIPYIITCLRCILCFQPEELAMPAILNGHKQVNADELQLMIDSSSFVPFYEQIVDQVRTMIKADKLKEGQVFCSEGEIARKLGISKMPVRQAFQKLRSEGLLIVARGKRPVIGSGRVPWNFQQLRGFGEEMRRRGLVPSAKLLDATLGEPDLET